MVTKSAKRITGFLGTSALTRPLFMLGAASALLGTGPAHAQLPPALPATKNAAAVVKTTPLARPKAPAVPPTTSTPVPTPPPPQGDNGEVLN